MSSTTSVASDVLAQAKWAFSTRRVSRSDAGVLSDAIGGAVSGDLVLGRVDRIGSHKRIQLAEGRASELYIGDVVVLACGDRYAPDQFEGLASLNPHGADMLAGGGVLGSLRHRHARMAAPTRIIPLGLLSRSSGHAINVADYALEGSTRPSTMTVIGVVGTSMNAGKTTAVAALAHGLTRAGHSVAAIKATGTGAFGDFNAYIDSGARFVADFTDAGMVSTYRHPLARIEAAIDTLLGHAARSGCEVAVVELADGVVQKETAELLRTPRIRNGFAGLILASPDALGAAGGCSILRNMGIEPVALTGMVSCSPLATAEAEAATDIRVIGRKALCDPAQANALLAQISSGLPDVDGAALVAVDESAA